MSLPKHFALLKSQPNLSDSPDAKRHLEAIILQQLQVMSLQIDTLRSRSLSTSALEAPSSVLIDQMRELTSGDSSIVPSSDLLASGVDRPPPTVERLPNVCLHEWFDERANLMPQAIAAIFGSETLTYGELQHRSNQLANFLRDDGLQKGNLVGIFTNRSPEMLISVLGTLIAGGSYVPLDPHYPSDRLEFMVKDARLTRILTIETLEPQLSYHGAQTLCLDRDWLQIAQASSATPPNVNDPQDTAYVVYTSGSTGTPKGVLGLHQATLNRCQWMWKAYPFEAGEVCCQKTSLNFVDSVWEIFGPLLQGIPTLYIPDTIVKQPMELINMLSTHAVSRIVLVPSLMRTLLELTPDLQARLPMLNYWISSGEALALELAQQFKSRLPDRCLINLYGSSEVAGDVTYYQVQHLESEVSIPIGRPISNAQIYLLDDVMQEVPIGEVGEIYVGGDVLAGGYLNRPDLTRERFLDNPFTPDLNGRLYKTGDLGRYRSDGNIDYVGRTDDQVKLRGFRIELGEIETTLLRHREVRQAIVIVRANHPGQIQLIAYVEGGSGLSSRQLRHYLSQTLPDYMVPSQFLFLDAFPLTPNGKVDRLSLKIMPMPTPLVEHDLLDYVAPRNHLESQLVAIWQALTQYEEVGVFDHFFAIGGDSLLAARMLATVQDRTGQTLSFDVFVENPTVADLANRLSGGIS